MPTILVIDDDRSVIEMVSRALSDSDTEIVSARSAGEGREVLFRRKPQIDVCLLDILLPDVSGLEAFEEFHRLDGKLPIVFITSDDSSVTAIEAMKKGAFDYVLKPLDLPKLKSVVDKAVDMRRKMLVPVEIATEVLAQESSDPMIGHSPAMLQVYKAIGRVAPQNVTVLVCGESGTGKELVARAIYHHGPRADQAFLAVNCAAIPDTLLESELFGHEKGAFTGADRRRIGKFEQCTGGTIFLDEIGDMPQPLQSKILRLLQSQEFERVGGNETIRTDVRIIAATHCDLEKLVEKGQFREDLYYRLRGFVISLPPLRNRKGDLPLLLSHFLARYNRELGKNVESISPDVMEMFRRYSWPGNVRELENVIKQTLVQTTGSMIVSDFLPSIMDFGPTESTEHGEHQKDTDGLASFIESRLRAGSEDLYAECIEFLERRLVARVLRETEGNQSGAARILGITRGSLRNKIRTLGIEMQNVVSVRPDDPD